MTSPKSINLQTRPQTPSARVMFENNNTSHPNQQQCTTAPQNKEKLNDSHVSTKIPVTTTLSKALRKMPENKISNPSFNKGHDSGLAFNQTSKNSIQEKIKMFENNTPFNSGSKVSSCSIKKVSNRSNFLS
ncbi:hypothetical protein DM84_00345 [Wolbachia pipientis]|nr:hypothetical protein [Wolbachia pipientis]